MVRPLPTKARKVGRERCGKKKEKRVIPDGLGKREKKKKKRQYHLPAGNESTKLDSKSKKKRKVGGLRRILSTG